MDLKGGKARASKLSPSKGRRLLATLRGCVGASDRTSVLRRGDKAGLHRVAHRDHLSPRSFGRPEARDAEVEAAAQSVAAHDFVAQPRGATWTSSRSGAGRSRGYWASTDEIQALRGG